MAQARRTPRSPRPRRRWGRALLIALFVLGLLAGAAVLAAPRVGRWYLREKLLPRVARILERRVKVGRIELGSERIALHEIELRGPRDGKEPLLRLARVESDFDWWQALRGKLEVAHIIVDSPRLRIVRSADGQDNISDLLRRRPKAASKRIRLGDVVLSRGTLLVDDQARGLRLSAAELSGKVVLGGRSKLVLGLVELKLPLPAPKQVTFRRLELTGRLSRRDPSLEEVKVEGGRLTLLPRLELSGITGTLRPKLAERRVELDLSGSYGGAVAKLWAASGYVEPWARRGRLEIKAARFKLGRIASILAPTPVILPERTSVDGRLSLAYEAGALAFDGTLAVSRLNLFHPGLARTPVLDVGATVVLKGEARRERVTVSKLNVKVRGIELALTGKVDRIGGKPLIEARLVMPAVDCQTVLDAIPTSLVPKLAGFKLRGKLSADLRAEIDYEALAQLKLGGSLPIRRCKVKEAPTEVSAERLQEPFDATVEAEPGQHRTFTVGPENPDYVPYEAIAKHVVNAFLTTEDGAFFKHKGFIRSQFRAALARNLARGGFRLGASTISMQMVKNVLLTHEKTLSRKLQELFLVWYLEQNLSKERIMEIYLNVIEFGPGIFGIGRASQHYFGKPASEITPLEAAFFATILPAPRRRYVQYCHGKLTDGWNRYVRRVLRRMQSKGRVTKEEMEAAEKQEIVFNRDMVALTERDCKKQVKDNKKAWREEYIRRLREAVMAAAPHQVSRYVPAESPPSKN